MKQKEATQMLHSPKEVRRTLEVTSLYNAVQFVNRHRDNSRDWPDYLAGLREAIRADFREFIRNPERGREG